MNSCLRVIGMRRATQFSHATQEGRAGSDWPGDGPNALRPGGSGLLEHNDSRVAMDPALDFVDDEARVIPINRPSNAARFLRTGLLRVWAHTKVAAALRDADTAHDRRVAYNRRVTPDDHWFVGIPCPNATAADCPAL